MARTKQQQLDDLDALIASVESQEIAGYSSEGTSVQLPNLKDLYEQRKTLEKEVLKVARKGKLKVKRAIPNY